MLLNELEKLRVEGVNLGTEEALPNSLRCYMLSRPYITAGKKKTVYDQNPQSKNIVRFRSQTAWREHDFTVRTTNGFFVLLRIWEVPRQDSAHPGTYASISICTSGLEEACHLVTCAPRKPLDLHYGKNRATMSTVLFSFVF